MKALYVYVDESGQDNAGELFVVAAVLVFAEQQEAMERSLLELERVSKRVRKKWKRTSIERRRVFLKGLGRVLEHGQLVWMQWQGKQYVEHVANTALRILELTFGFLGSCFGFSSSRFTFHE